MTAPGHVSNFGASSGIGIGIGIELARRLVVAGQGPVVVTRGSPSAALVAVVSLVGGRPFRRDVPPDWEGNRHLIDAGRPAGVRRLVLATSIGSGSSRAAALRIARLILSRFMGFKSQAEQYLRDSDLDWTIA